MEHRKHPKRKKILLPIDPLHGDVIRSLDFLSAIVGTMVKFCSVVGCGQLSDRDEGVRFFRFPAKITHQGERTMELSEKRSLWLARIHRDHFQPSDNTCVCSKHFVTGNMYV